LSETAGLVAVLFVACVLRERPLLPAASAAITAAAAAAVFTAAVAVAAAGGEDAAGLRAGKEAVMAKGIAMGSNGIVKGNRGEGKNDARESMPAPPTSTAPPRPTKDVSGLTK
jgi:hypothetical protein